MGRWYVNGVSLSRYAYNVRNRSAGWSMAAKRGDNLVVPGRSGNVFLKDKPSDVGKITLSMWALGVNHDGTIPQDYNSRLAIERHMDALTRIFGDSGLLEIARTDDDAVEYGRTNMIPNPSFESTLGQEVVRENRVVNSSVEYVSGYQAIRRNFALNPSFEATAGKMAYRRNLLPNPRMSTLGVKVTNRRNLVQNPSFEANLKMWSAGINAKADRVRRDIGGRGPYVARLTCTSAGASRLNGGVAHADPGTSYAVQMKCRNNAAVARDMRLEVRWWGKNGLLSTSTVQTVSVPSGGDETLSGVVTAPASTRYAVLRASQMAAAVDDVALWDEAQIEEGATVGTYFDGQYPDRDGLRYRWIDASGFSISEEFRTNPRGYVAEKPDIVGGLSERESRRGFQSMRLWCVNTPTTGDRMFGTNARDAAKVAAGKQVSGAFWARLHPSMDDSATRLFIITMPCYDQDGDYLGDCETAAGGGNPVAMSTDAADANGWTKIALDGAWTLPGTVRVGIKVSVGASAWVAGDSCYVDTFIVEKGTFVGDYFDGATKDDETFVYGWADEKQWSPSTQVGRWVEWWATEGGVGFQAVTEDARRGEMVYRLLPRPWMKTTDRLRAKTFSDSVRPGREHTFSIYVKPNRALNMRADLQWSTTQSKTTAQGTPLLCAADTWTRVTVTAVCPDGTEAVFPIIRCTDAPTGDDEIDLDCALLEPAGYVRKWFNGRSGDGYGWIGKPHLSESVYFLRKATGWQPYGSAHPAIWREKGAASDGSFYVAVTPNEDGNAGISAGRSEIDTDDPRTFAVDAWADGATQFTAGIVWRDAKNNDISRSEQQYAYETGWNRMVVTGDPPPDAAFAAGYCYRHGVTDGQVTRFDAALFGFGGASDYKDGDNGSGWKWVGEKGLSASEEYGAAPLMWTSWDGTLEQSAAWDHSRGHSGLFVTIDDANPRVAPHVPAKWDDRQFMGLEGETVTFAVWVKARETCRVRARLSNMTYNGLRFIDHQAGPAGQWTDLAAGEVQRIKVSGIPIPVGSDATHFRCVVQVQANGGGPAPLGTGIWLDDAVASYGTTDTYIDGTDAWVRWTAGADQSPSEVYGPARRARAEVVAGFESESMAGGTRAEFDVELQVPDVYWEDTWVTEDDYPIPSETSIVTLVGLKGMTAPVDDAIIEVHGPFRDIRLTDIGTGAWVEIHGQFRDDQTVYIDSGEWTVKDRKGRSRITQIKHGGHPRLLPLTCEPKKPWPRIEIHADGVGADAFLRVRARRRFHVA